MATPRSAADASGGAGWLRRHVALVSVAILTLLAGVVVARFVRLDPDIVALLPAEGDSAALGRYIRGFGGGGISVVLVEGDDPAETRAAADEIAAKLRERSSVAFTAAKIELPTETDPLLLWRTADAETRARLARALSPEGMRERLAGTREILLAPGSGAAVPALTRDPLRLSSIAFESKTIGSGVRARSDGYFATDDGRAHVVLVKAKGQALRGDDAKAFVGDVDATLAPIRAAHPGVTLGVTGPHAVAAEMESMLRRDLTYSGTISMVLASLAFAAVFRRIRALLAVAPPLALGTLWTAALAAFWPGGISAIAVAFTSVVVGVGFDTGVHVYA
ncbi:MAG TPA: MMPL family transporter, partial [Polyangiaceae bacterium]|nr:MMPL family transporter [Polyangiaceae bacterium]